MFLRLCWRAPRTQMWLELMDGGRESNPHWPEDMDRLKNPQNSACNVCYTSEKVAAERLRHKLRR